MMLTIRSTVIILLVSMTIQTEQLSKKISKKVHHEIRSVFETEQYELSSVHVSDDINEKLIKKLTGNNFFRISQEKNTLGFAVVDQADSKTDFFNYMIVLAPDFTVKKVKILIYREDYGGEIASKRWLRQFVGKSGTDKLLYEKDIIAISGATISANAMTHAMNNWLQTIKILKLNTID